MQTPVSTAKGDEFAQVRVFSEFPVPSPEGYEMYDANGSYYLRSVGSNASEVTGPLKFDAKLFLVDNPNDVNLCHIITFLMRLVR